MALVNSSRTWSGLLLNVGAKGRRCSVLDKGRACSGNAKIDAEIAVHGPGLDEHPIFPPRNRLDGDAKMFGQFTLAQSELLTILTNLAGWEQGKLFSEGIGNL